MRYLFCHTGLGDMIIFNGLVREIIKDNIPTTIFVKHMYYDFFKEMYKDISEQLLQSITVANDGNDINEVAKIVVGKDSCILTGCLGSKWPGSDPRFDETCYKQANVDYNKRWDSFKYARNIEAEMNIFKKYRVVEKNYIFVHDDPLRNFVINRNLPTNYHIVNPNINLTKNIFNYRYLIENAAEVHCIDSCFRCMIETFDINKNLYYHQYARHPTGKLVVWNAPASRKNWIIYI